MLFLTSFEKRVSHISVIWRVRLEQDIGDPISCGYNFLSVIKENVSISS